jgi:pyruvate kinase
MRGDEDPLIVRRDGRGPRHETGRMPSFYSECVLLHPPKRPCEPHLVRPTFDIVATLGPASFGMTRDLARAGATALRFNASHLSPADLAQRAAQAHRDAPGLPLVVDLQGAKMRVGHLAEREVAAGTRVRFSVEPASAEDVPLPHPELFAAAEVGETVGLDDGRLRFLVRGCGPGWLEAEALVAGVLRPRKGVNLLEHPVRLSGLTPADAERLDAVRSLPGVQVAWSFTLDGREAEWVRARRPATPVIAKIERREAVAALGEIARRVDAVWVCRGDLGEQLGPAELGSFVGSLAPARFACPVLMAGQVLEHLTRHREPTRSELCHLHDLVTRGYAGAVLSDETAIGLHPVHAVEEAAALVRAFSNQRRP